MTTTELAKILQLSESQLVAAWLYGSRIYGIHEPYSDYDYLVVVDNLPHKSQTLRRTEGDFFLFSLAHFQELLRRQHPLIMEVLAAKPLQPYPHPWSINPTLLKTSALAKAEHDFSFAQKKLLANPIDLNAKKILWHSLRVLSFTQQLLLQGSINFTSTNSWWTQLKSTEFELTPWQQLFQHLKNNLQ